MRQTSKSIQFTNSLLLKDEVGKSKPTTYDVLPHQDFYGKYTFIDPENAKELSMTWKNHEHSNPITQERDFRKLNKMCIQNNLHNSKHFSGFRKNNDARLTITEGQKIQPIYLPEESFTYGLQNRPSTPIKALIAHQYTETEPINHYENLLIRQSYKIPLSRKENKAHKLWVTANKDKMMKLSEQFTTKKEYFKLQKFKDVMNKTSTRRHSEYQPSYQTK